MFARALIRDVDNTLAPPGVPPAEFGELQRGDHEQRSCIWSSTMRERSGRTSLRTTAGRDVL